MKLLTTKFPKFLVQHSHFYSSALNKTNEGLIIQENGREQQDRKICLFDFQFIGLKRLNSFFSKTLDCSSRK
jgi:hypothetical protein